MTADAIVAISAAVVACVQMLKSEEVRPDSSVENLIDQRAAHLVLKGELIPGDDVRAVTSPDLDDQCIGQMSTRVLLSSWQSLAMDNGTAALPCSRPSLSSAVAIVIPFGASEQMVRAAACGDVAGVKYARQFGRQRAIRQDVGDHMSRMVASVKPEAPMPEVRESFSPQPTLAGRVDLRPEPFRNVATGVSALAGESTVAAFARFNFVSPCEERRVAPLTGAGDGTLTGHQAYSWCQPRVVTATPGYFDASNYTRSLRVEAV